MRLIRQPTDAALGPALARRRRGAGRGARWSRSTARHSGNPLSSPPGSRRSAREGTRQPLHATRAYLARAPRGLKRRRVAALLRASLKLPVHTSGQPNISVPGYRTLCGAAGYITILPPRAEAPRTERRGVMRRAMRCRHGRARLARPRLRRASLLAPSDHAVARMTLSAGQRVGCVPHAYCVLYSFSLTRPTSRRARTNRPEQGHRQRAD